MRIFYFFLVLTAFSYSMEKKAIEAILKGQLKNVQKIIREIKSDENQHSPDTPLMQPTKVDIEKLHSLATQLLDQKKQAIQTLNNPSMYKRLSKAVASLGLGFGGATFYIYHGIVNGQWGSGQTMALAASSCAVLVLHGGNDLRLALSNADAHQAHAQHVAILHEINQERQLSPES